MDHNFLLKMRLKGFLLLHSRNSLSKLVFRLGSLCFKKVMWLASMFLYLKLDRNQ